jgi:hypothetical protein
MEKERRQVRGLCSNLTFAKVEFVFVDEKVGQIKEFWNEFLYIGHLSIGSMSRSRFPCFFHRMEQSIAVVELAG